MRSQRYILGLLVLLLVVLGFPASSRAVDFGEVIVKEKAQGPLLLSGTRITTEAGIIGDVYLIGEEVTIRGPIKGDVFCLAQKVTIDSKVDGDIRLLAADMELNAPCTGSLTVLGNSFWLWQEASCKEIFLAVNSAQLNGKIDGGLRGQADTIYINGIVAGKTDIHASKKLTLGSRAALQGGLAYRSPVKFTKEAGSTISGEPDYKSIKKPQNTGVDLWAVMASWLSALFIWWLGRVLHPAIWQNWGGNLTRHPWISLFLGGMVLLLLSPLLVLSVFGISAAVILAAMIGIVGYLGRVVVAVGFSFYLIQGGRFKPGTAMMIALVPVVMLTFLPSIGMMFVLTFACMGLGSLLYTLRASRWGKGFDQVV